MRCTLRFGCSLLLSFCVWACVLARVSSFVCSCALSRAFVRASGRFFCLFVCYGSRGVGRVGQYSGVGACIGDNIYFIYYLYLFICIVARQTRRRGAWHVAVLAVARSTHGGAVRRAGGAIGTPRATERGAAEGAAPIRTPARTPPPLHTDGDVCGEGVNTGRSGAGVALPTLGGRQWCGC